MEHKGLRARLAENRFYQRLSRAKYRLMTRISPKWNSDARMRQVYGRKPDWAHPTLFYEKLMKLKVDCYNKSPLVKRVCDKYLVLDYLRENGCGSLIKECYGAWDSVDDIPFDALPERFVLKNTLGCGHHVFCRDKSKLDVDAAKATLSQAWRDRAYLDYSELQYRPDAAVPQRVMCERLLEIPAGQIMPDDIKLYCFHGEPKYVLYCFERDAEGHAKYYFIDAQNWTQASEYAVVVYPSIPPRPARFDDMLEAARKLSKPFPFVRADFYEENGKAIFGELTFTPGGNVELDYTDAGQKRMGELIDLDRVDWDLLK